MVLRASSFRGAAALVCAVVALAVVAAPVARAEVEVMTASTFAAAIKEEAYLVKFYAPWCGHCKHLAPIFERASERLAGQMKFGKVDATVHTVLKTKYDISGYPTIKFFRDGTVQDYGYPRTEQGFVDFVERMNGPSIHRLATESKVKDFTHDKDVTFIFAKPEGGLEGDNDMYDAFKEASRTLQAKHTFAETRAASWVTSFEGHEAPFIVKIEDGEAPVFYSGAADATELQEWVEENQFQIMTEINGMNFRPLSYSGRYLAIGVVNPGQKAQTDTFLNALKRLARPTSPLAEDVRNKFYFCSLDGVRWADFIAQFNIKQKELPRLFVLDGETKTFFEDVEVDEIDEMETFLANVVKGKVPAQREGIWGLPSRLWRNFLDWMPYSAIALVGGIIVLVVGCMTAASEDHAKGE